MFFVSEEDGQVYKQMKRLQDARDAREFMQSLVNAYDKNRISKDKARTLGYLIKIFINTYETAEIQGKVEELEDMINQKNRFSA